LQVGPHEEAISGLLVAGNWRARPELGVCLAERKIRKARAGTAAKSRRQQQDSNESAGAPDRKANNSKLPSRPVSSPADANHFPAVKKAASISLPVAPDPSPPIPSRRAVL